MRAVTVVARIRQGQEETLRALLSKINDDIEGNPVIRFADDVATHFARWYIIDTDGQGPRLVFAATVNGDLRSYAQEMMRVSPGLDEIWGACEGYAGRADFPDFLRRVAVPTRYFFAGYPAETVTSIRAKIAIRRQLDELADGDAVAAWLRGPEAGRLLSLAGERPASAAARWRSAVARALQRVATPLAARGTRMYADLGEPEEYPKLVDIYSDPGARRAYLDHGRELAANVSPYAQNQLTVAAPVLPDRLFRLRLALLMGGYLARYGYPPGQLNGTYTIHSLHWSIIDQGRTGLVMSNYDGSWENYLGDFADKLTDGLNALFNNCGDYPPGGLHRIEAWGQWIRTAQLIVPLYYSAYPTETAAHIARDRAIAAAALDARHAPDATERVLSLL